MSDALYVDYTDPAEVQKFWLTNIAPKYFNFDTTELHRTGEFGYTNEVMSTVESDTAHAVSIARREFYPTTAQYTKSLYKMAALQQIPYPMTNPAQATAILLITEKELISYSEYSNGRYKFVLDDTMVVNAGDIPFMLDFPIVIIAKPKKVGSSILQVNSDDPNAQTRYAFTIRYDKTYSNDLNKIGANYIYYRSVTYNGERYLLFKVSLHQVSLVTMTESINKSPLINNVTVDFPFDGKLSNFEVFYSEANSDTVYQLKKIPLNGNPSKEKFCMYSLTNESTLRITFPENAYFSPKFNSNITVKLYTTLGSEGNFSIYKGNLVCKMDSEKYPYNNMVTITGQIQGSAIGGADISTQDDFRTDVIAAYATNKTITTENDLQVYFDAEMTDTRTKIIFQKKRDDVFERLYGAYMILKDLRGFVVPTNSLNLDIFEDQMDVIIESYGKAILKPGKVFKYQSADEGTYISGEYNLYDTGASLNTDINDNVTDFCFTNIFLMHFNKSPNMAGYYLNTMNTSVPVEPVFVNDNSFIQFTINSFTIKRNAVRGENFYKISVTLQPSIINTVLKTIFFLTPEELSSIDNEPTEIRAEFDGIVEGFKYMNSSVFMIIRYTPGENVHITRDVLTKYAQEPGMPTDKDDPNDMRIFIRISSPVQYEKQNDGSKEYFTPSWYTTTLEAGDTFTQGSVIAYRKPRDLGVLRVIAELQGDTFGLYIPLTLEEYDEEPDTYTYTAYLSTDDIMNEDGRLEIIGGFSNIDGCARNYVSIDPTDCKAIISTFLRYDDVNTTHQYSSYDYLKTHTMTNSYKTDSKTFDFLTPMKFIRSVLAFDSLSVGEGEEAENQLLYKISEIPLVRSNWIKNSGNVFDLVNMIRTRYEHLLQVYDLLENNYSIDQKFFNTYGKSRFFRIGIKDSMEILYKVNIVLKFGIKLNMLSPYEEFKPRFIAYIRSYIESFNDVDNKGNSIYIMDLITSIKNDFTEIERLEFYGVDNYSVANAQNIESISDDEIRKLGYNRYIPEFINVYCDYFNNELTPKIDIVLLE